MNKSKYKAGDKIILTQDTQGLKKGTTLTICEHDIGIEYNCSYVHNDKLKYNNFFEDEFRIKINEDFFKESLKLK